MGGGGPAPAAPGNPSEDERRRRKQERGFAARRGAGGTPTRLVGLRPRLPRPPSSASAGLGLAVFRRGAPAKPPRRRNFTPAASAQNAFGSAGPRFMRNREVGALVRRGLVGGHLGSFASASLDCRDGRCSSTGRSDSHLTEFSPLQLHIQLRSCIMFLPAADDGTLVNSVCTHFEEVVTHRLGWVGWVP